MTHPAGLPTYHCEGGRSFTVDQPTAGLANLQSSSGSSVSGSSGSSGSSSGGGSSSSDFAAPHPSTWYIAVSNCAALHGLELRYRLVVYGHVGECPPPHSAHPGPGEQPQTAPSSAGYRSPQHGDDDDLTSEDGGMVLGQLAPDVSCRVTGKINTTSTWHGSVCLFSCSLCQ